MGDRVFLDTNILVYAFDTSDNKKHKTAAKLVGDAFRDRNSVLSTQVLKEFFVVVTSKIPKRLDPLEAKEVIKRLSFLEVVETTVPLVLRGIDVQRKNTISFWDAMIVAAARAANCVTLLTEDLSRQTVIEGLRIVNPFADGPEDETSSDPAPAPG